MENKFRCASCGTGTVNGSLCTDCESEIDCQWEVNVRIKYGKDGALYAKAQDGKWYQAVKGFTGPEEAMSEYDREKYSLIVTNGLVIFADVNDKGREEV